MSRFAFPVPEELLEAIAKRVAELMAERIVAIAGRTQAPHRPKIAACLAVCNEESRLADCLARIREYVGRLPRVDGLRHRVRPATAPARPADALYDILPQDHRLSYDMRHVLGFVT